MEEGAGLRHDPAGGVRIPPYVGYPLLAAAAFAAAWFTANRQVFHPMKYPEGWWETQRELGAEDVWFATPDGVRLHAWWSAVPGARTVTLYLHGNAGNVSHRGSHVRAINAAGSSILLIDYRGYGKSEGRPSEGGLYTDAEAAYRYLLEQSYRPEQIIAHGESLGTSVAVDLAAKVPVGGVILEAPFTSAADVAHRLLPFLGRLLIRVFPTREKIGMVKAPLLIIHGEADEIIPIRMGQALYEQAPEPKSFWAIPGVGHNGIVEAAGTEYVERLREFYERPLEGRMEG